MRDSHSTVDRISLRFSSDELEKEFRVYYLGSVLYDMQRSLLVGMGLVILFGFLDYTLFPTVYKQLLAIRFGIMLPIPLLVYLLGFYEPFQRYLPLGLMISAYDVGVTITWMTLIVPSPGSYVYYVGVCLIVVYSYTFARLRFIQSVVICFAISLTYTIAQLAVAHMAFAYLLNNLFFLISFNVIGMAASYTIERFVRGNFVHGRELATQNEMIKEQQELAESLLLNTLPAQIAQELRDKKMVQPRYSDDVTILFTDFAGFTLATESLTAEELVARLHDYFTAFDQITGCFGLEKLKTIGDSYMCVAGLPTHRMSHAVDALLAAFEFLDAVKKRQNGHANDWSVRIGLHSGPVISGVVGIKKFAYDIWGESVNFASRMESSSSPNRINLSSSTYARVKDFFDCEYRGKVQTKEGREYDMFFANGLHPSLLTFGDSVGSAFQRRYSAYFGAAPPPLPRVLHGKATASGV